MIMNESWSTEEIFALGSQAQDLLRQIHHDAVAAFLDKRK